MLNLPARIYSKAVWETIRYRTSMMSNIPWYRGKEDEDYPASVSVYTSDMLARITHLKKPFIVAEIGTYIGRSSYAIRWAMGDGGMLYTCDSETDLMRPHKGIVLHPKTSSTDMLANMFGLMLSVDMFFFDGRIQPNDLEHIKRLSKPDTLYLFDDFEGVEKGVCNALMLQNAGIGGILVYPEDGQTLGMIIRKIGLTRQ